MKSLLVVFSSFFFFFSVVTAQVAGELEARENSVVRVDSVTGVETELFRVEWEPEERGDWDPPELEAIVDAEDCVFVIAKSQRIFRPRFVGAGGSASGIPEYQRALFRWDGENTVSMERSLHFDLRPIRSSLNLVSLPGAVYFLGLEGNDIPVLYELNLETCSIGKFGGFVRGRPPVAVLGSLGVIDGDLLFVALTDDEGEQLWILRDGAIEPLTNIRTNFGILGWAALGTLNDTKFLVVDELLHGSELWVSKGSLETTRIVADLRPGAQASSPLHFLPLPTGISNGPSEAALFTALDEDGGRQIWITDGSAEGTFQPPFHERPWKGHRITALQAAGSRLLVNYSVEDTPQQAQVPLREILLPSESARIWVEHSDDLGLGLHYVTRTGEAGVQRSTDLVEWHDWMTLEGLSGVKTIEPSRESDEKGVFLRVDQSRVSVGSEPDFDLAIETEFGVAPSFEVSFDRNYNYAQLAADGISRVNLYFTWREFELGRRNPKDPEGSTLIEDVDPIIATLEKHNIKASIILEITATDCADDAAESCWLEFGMPQDLLYDDEKQFVGFDHERIASPLGEFVRELMQRYSSDIVTHVFVGNETDQYLKAHGHIESFINLMDQIGAAVADLPKRARTGTIFTFAPDSLVPGYNELARRIAPHVEVIGFTIYPFLYEAILNDAPVVPSAEWVSTWFNAATEAVDGRPFVVAETAHPADGRFGTVSDQKAYTQFLLDYLAETNPPIEFVTWWGIEDSETHPFEGFRHTGLKKSDKGAGRPAFDLWRK